MIRGVLLDLSGVLYNGNEVLPGAQDSIRSLRDAGMPVHYITNTTRKTSQSILNDLQSMQLGISPDELFTAPLAAKDYLQSRKLNPYLMIHPDLEEEFETPEPGHYVNAVLVGDAGSAFTYQRMNTAFGYLMEGAELLAMGVNRYFREGDQFSLDAGPFVRALEYAADCEATIIGKPSPDFYHSAVRSLACRPQEVVMVGDDVESDVLGAVDCGLQGILVRSGKYRQGDEDILGDRALCVADIAAAVDVILGSKHTDRAMAP